MNELPSLNELVKEAQKSFQENFGYLANKASCAPGRVNIIGEHVDYNGGFVLPMAMPMWTVLVGKLRSDRTCRFHTNEHSVDHRSYQIELPPVDSPGSHLVPITDEHYSWVNYVIGTIHEFNIINPLTCGFDCVISTSVPLGAGLSSSASLEAAVFTFLEEVSGFCVDTVAKALACQKAECDFANVPCGIMDQFASILCQENHLLLLDCKTQSVTHLSFNYPNHAFLVINSGVKHHLGDGPYRKRRSMCEAVAHFLGVETLRDSQLETLIAKKEALDSEHQKKAMHVFSEISRTKQVAEILTRGSNTLDDLQTIGCLMVQSHQSLRDLYQVSCVEIDTLVDNALKQEGVLGARITGGGFGGCCVVLLEKPAIPQVVTALNSVYLELYHHKKLQFYLASPQKGAMPIPLNQS